MARRRRRPAGPMRGAPDPLGVALSHLNRLPGRPLLEVEDRRTFHPERSLRPPMTFVGGASRLVAKRPPSSGRSSYPGARIGFEVPRAVVVCVRRKQRKEVLHALGKVGRGAGTTRRRRRNGWSDVDC